MKRNTEVGFDSILQELVDDLLSNTLSEEAYRNLKISEEKSNGCSNNHKRNS